MTCEPDTNDMDAVAAPAPAPTPPIGGAGTAYTLFVIARARLEAAHAIIVAAAIGLELFRLFPSITDRLLIAAIVILLVDPPILRRTYWRIAMRIMAIVSPPPDRAVSMSSGHAASIAGEPM